MSNIIAEILEDTTTATGHKKVLDSTPGDVTRTAQYRAGIYAFTQLLPSDGVLVPKFVDVDLAGTNQSRGRQGRASLARSLTLLRVPAIAGGV